MGIVEHIGRYEIRAELGRGGMGVVARAFDPELEREVAIKSMLVEGDESTLEHFFREARAAARLNHPGIVAVHDVIRDGNSAHIVMELIRGVSLEQNIPSGKPAALRILRETAAALDFAHSLGVVHRDIKPGNILIDESGHVKIADFGIAKVGNRQAPGDPAQTSGTAGYMAPEQIRGEALDGRADQFSLAVLAYKLVCGKLPFDAPNWLAVTYKILKDQPPPPESIDRNVSKAEAAAIMRGLAKQAADRFPNCLALVDALATGAAEQHRGYGLAAAISIAAIAGLASAAYFTVNRQQKTPEPQVVQVAPKKEEPPPVQPAPVAAPKAAPLRMEVGGTAFEFVSIPSGQFKMGSDDGRDTADERPAHLVAITKSFQLGKTEVTRNQWSAVMGGGLPDPQLRNLPAANVSYDEIQIFLAKLNARKDGFHYRLPTEAEWEYAARAGNKDPLYGKMDEIAWNADNSGRNSHQVGLKEPNAWGLYDMIGNVWEWVADWHAEGSYANSTGSDPAGPKSGTIKLFRGGSFTSGGMTLRVSYRQGSQPAERSEEVGFRLAR